MSTGYHVAVVGEDHVADQKNNVVGIQTFCWEDPCVQK